MNTIKCDNHPRKNATKNIQLAWVIYDVDKKGDYSEGEPDPNSEPLENAHLCDKCFEDWDEGLLTI